MANPYPALITDANSETRVAGQISFTDPANQPGGTAASGALVSLNGNATVNTGGVIPFDAVDFDTDGFWDAVDHRFAAPVGKAGLYLFILGLDAIDAAGITNVEAVLGFSNPVGLGFGLSSLGKAGLGPPDQWLGMATGIIRCNEGDFVSAQVDVVGAASVAVAASSCFQVVYLGPLP